MNLEYRRGDGGVEGEVGDGGVGYGVQVLTGFGEDLHHFLLFFCTHTWGQGRQSDASAFEHALFPEAAQRTCLFANKDIGALLGAEGTEVGAQFVIEHLVGQ